MVRRSLAIVACTVPWLGCLVVGALGDDDPAAVAARQARYEQFALTHDGDAERGAALFLEEKRTRCTLCHAIDGRGGDAGPDLSAIGGKFGRPHLIESLLEPSRQIVEGYRTSVIATTSGRTFAGIVKQTSAESVTLVDADGRRRVIATSEIEARRESELSLMPAELSAALTPQEFADLVAYLESRRPKGEPAPGGHVSGGIALPTGFEVDIVATGLTGCTALEALPDGRVLACEQTGALRVVKEGRLLEPPALVLEVDSHWERGLIGVTVDPDFPRAPWVYVCYVAKAPYPHHRVSRFQLAGDLADPASEQLLLAGDDQRQLGGNVPAGHQGGALHFGPDGKLYIAIGEQTAGLPAQDLRTFQGKLLRIERDGRIPADNPFVGAAQGKYRAIWALGLRNPFTFAIRRDGRMCINDIGGDKFEEVNLGQPGGNYGWPQSEGPVEEPRFVSPIHWYPRASVCGGDFGPDSWLADFRGQYFFADYIHGWIKMLDVDRPGEPETFATGLRNPVDLRFAPDGGLYVLLRNAWVIDDKFQPGTGTLLRIRPAAVPKASR